MGIYKKLNLFTNVYNDRIHKKLYVQELGLLSIALQILME